jgi:hypothetical protein
MAGQPYRIRYRERIVRRDKVGRGGPTALYLVIFQRVNRGEALWNALTKVE